MSDPARVQNFWWVCLQFCGPRRCPLPSSSDYTWPRCSVSVFSVLIVGGGVTDGHGEGKTGAGVHEGDAVLHSAVTGREGNSCDQPSGREKKTLRGSSGDEVSVIILFFRHMLSWNTCPHRFHFLAPFVTPDTLSLILMLTCVSHSLEQIWDKSSSTRNFFCLPVIEFCSPLECMYPYAIVSLKFLKPSGKFWQVVELSEEDNHCSWGHTMARQFLKTFFIINISKGTQK